MRAVFFVLLLLPFVIPVLVDDAFAADWYSTSWEYRKKIEISLNSEISSDLSNFPVLVSVIDSDYKFWEGIGITQERCDQIVLEIQSEPKPKMIQTGFV